MRSAMRFSPRSVAPGLGVALGLVAGVATMTWTTAVAGRSTAELRAVFDATHLPPLLTAENEPVTLTYHAHCAASGVESSDAGCDVRGTVFARAVGERSFRALPLAPRVESGIRRLDVQLPDELGAASRGVEYYATLDAPALGETITLPAGGSDAPHVSRPLGRGVTIELGRHQFGGARRVGTRVASATWGDRAGQVGLEQGRNLAPTGASAFDVDRGGTVVVLDQAHRRLLRWTRGSPTPAHVPVSVSGTLADMSLADDGSIYVLETTSAPGRNPLVRQFDDGGRELEAIEAPERTASRIEVDARGPVVQTRPSHHWSPVHDAGVPASREAQLRRGRPGLRLGNGDELIVFRHAEEVRVALVAGGRARTAWRIVSASPLAEVQLAETWGQRVVIVVRVYADGTDEFLALVLDRDGLVDRFALDAVDWAEAAPLGRFRLVGGSLYRLGSSPDGVFVDRFDLEVR